VKFEWREKEVIQMDKKGSAEGKAIAVVLSILAILVVIFGVLYFTGNLPQTGVGGTTETNIVESSKEGTVAQLQIDVYDASQNNVNTKVAVAIYCVDGDGNFLIDGTVSSTSTSTTKSTTIGTSLTCYAFNSTYQTVKPVEIKVGSETEPVRIDVFQVATTAKMEFFSQSPEALANEGASNVTITSDGSDSFAKMRFENNNTDKWIPLAGFYFNTVEGTNISSMDLSGSASLSGMDHASTQINVGSLSTAVSSRKNKFDYVFDISDSTSNTKYGHADILVLEENDYLETGAVVFKSAEGCDAVTENAVTGYAFTKGYFKSSKVSDVLWGYESDQSSGASVITADITGTTVYCDN
jgi:hypothetical protein